MFIIEVLVACGKPTEQWCALHASEDKEPYRFATREVAEKVMYMCYPRAEHYGFVRVVQEGLTMGLYDDNEARERIGQPLPVKRADPADGTYVVDPQTRELVKVAYIGRWVRPSHDPRPDSEMIGRDPLFRYHNCPRCLSGERACIRGNPIECDWPHARND